MSFVQMKLIAQWGGAIREPKFLKNQQYDCYNICTAIIINRICRFRPIQTKVPVSKIFNLIFN